MLALLKPVEIINFDFSFVFPSHFPQSTLHMVSQKLLVSAGIRVDENRPHTAAAGRAPALDGIGDKSYHLG